MSIELINTYAAKSAIAGWFVGLAYYNWFSSHAHHVPWWGHLILILPGLFFASVVIGAVVALILAGVTKIIFGKYDATGDIIAWGFFISPVLAFLAAGYAVAMF